MNRSFPPFLTPVLGLLLFALSGSFGASSDRIQVPSQWPEGTRWYRELEEAARKVERQTRGRVEVVIYERSLVEELPELAIYALPLAFVDDEALARSRRALDEAVSNFLIRRELIPIGIEHIGNGHIFSIRPATPGIGTLVHFQESRLWVPKKADNHLIGSLGTKAPVPLPFDKVRNALGSGAI
ncbi:MAG: hypothetical protein AAGC68_10135, partial [Verrucomicrobiota bacterium]